MLQMRPRDTNGPMYAPNRDIAYCFANLVKTALNGMAEVDWQAWYGDYLHHHAMTEKDLGDVAVALANGFGNFCDVDMKTPGEALDKAGFFNCPAPAIMAVCAKIGQVMIGAYFTSVRDVLRADEDRPAAIVDLQKRAQELSKVFDERCGGSLPDNG